MFTMTYSPQPEELLEDAIPGVINVKEYSISLPGEDPLDSTQRIRMHGANDLYPGKWVIERRDCFSNTYDQIFHRFLGYMPLSKKYDRHQSWEACFESAQGAYESWREYMDD